MARVQSLRCFLFLLPNYIRLYAIIRQYFSYLDKREVLQQEYSQVPILPSPHFRWVVNVKSDCLKPVRYLSKEVPSPFFHTAGCCCSGAWHQCDVGPQTRVGEREAAPGPVSGGGGEALCWGMGGGGGSSRRRPGGAGSVASCHPNVGHVT